MANVVVVGSGFAGLSAAIRLAKLRHEVTVLESTSRLGGQLNGIDRDGLNWQVHPVAVTLPGVFRDLFAKSGSAKPGMEMDHTLTLTPVGARRHAFKDKRLFDLPLGNRGDQHTALIAEFGEDLWSPWVDGYAEVWDSLRRVTLDRVFNGKNDFSAKQWRSLRPRRPVSKVARKDISDERHVKFILDPLRLSGDDRRVTPGFVAVQHYLERSFGLWSFEGGRPALADALTNRIAERHVNVEYDTHATDVVLASGSVCAVRAGSEQIDADYVIWAAPSWPQSLPPCPEMRRMPSPRVHLLLDDSAPAMPAEVAIHANPPLRMWTNAPRQWTIEYCGGEDPVIAMVRCGVDLRAHIVERWDQSATDLVTQGHWGWLWQNWTTALNRPGVNPRGGLYFAGAHAHPGSSLEMIGMATAAIAEHIGRASD